MTVSGGTITQQFGINLCTAFFGVFILFKNQYTRTFGKHKAVPVLIERA